MLWPCGVFWRLMEPDCLNRLRNSVKGRSGRQPTSVKAPSSSCRQATIYRVPLIQSGVILSGSVSWSNSMSETQEALMSARVMPSSVAVRAGGFGGGRSLDRRPRDLAAEAFGAAGSWAAMWSSLLADVALRLRHGLVAGILFGQESGLGQLVELAIDIGLRSPEAAPLQLGESGVAGLGVVEPSFMDQPGKPALERGAVHLDHLSLDRELDLVARRQDLEDRRRLGLQSPLEALVQALLVESLRGRPRLG